MLTYVAWLAIIAVGAVIFAGVRSRTSNPAALWLVFGGVSAAMVAFMWYVSEPGDTFPDFRHAYYFAGQQIRDDPRALYSTLEPTSAFTNIPIVAWLFVPLTFVPEGPASWIMFAIGVAAIALACAVMIRMSRATGVQPYVIAALFVVNGPLYNSLREGNTTHIILLVLVIALWCAERRRYVPLGVTIALGAIIKPPLVLLLVPFLLRRRWGAAGGFAAAAVPIIALSVGIYGIDLHRTWYDTTVAPFSQHPIGAFNVQSLDAFLVRIISGPAHLFDWDPALSFGAEFRILSSLLTLAIGGGAGAVCWRWRARPEQAGSAVAGIKAAEQADMRLEFCVALALAFILTPISWSHYYLTLIIPMSLLVTGQITLPEGRPWIAWLAACMLLLSAPVMTLNPDRFLIGGLNSHIITSHFVIGGAALLALLLALRYHGALAEPASLRVRRNQPNALRAVP